jgi:hypothetical protein
MSEYMRTRPPEVLTAQERARYAASQREHEAVAADASRPMSVREVAKAKAREARTRLALDARARTADHTPCGARGRCATSAERHALAAHLSQQYAEPVPHWRPVPPPTMAANRSGWWESIQPAVRELARRRAS